MSRSLTAWSRWVSLAECSRSSFAFNYCVQVSLSLFLFRWCRWRLSVGSVGFYVLDYVLRPVTSVELPKRVFTSGAGWMSLIIKLYTSANMFYLLKHLLLLNLVIFKLKCNNLTFNEMLSLYASYVCLLHSRFIENHPIWILEDGPLISEVVLSQARYVWTCPDMSGQRSDMSGPGRPCKPQCQQFMDPS
jgi:hypothetical protein